VWEFKFYLLDKKRFYSFFRLRLRAYGCPFDSANFFVLTSNLKPSQGGKQIVNKIFVRVYSLFILFLVCVGIFFIYVTRPKDRTGLVEVMPIKATDSVRENPMILIPAGPFIMGSDRGGVDEAPRRTVYLDAYEINQFEVTQFHYGEFVQATGHRSPLSRYVKNIDYLNNANQPVVYVSWNDAYEYCQWRGARLPTEAEWEKAARGVNGNEFPWQAEGKAQAIFANFKGIADKGVFTMTVGSYEMDKSPFAVYDMAGNVREWVQDWYEEQYYRSAPDRNPKGPETGETKVLRGSSWTDSRIAGRTSFRLKMVPGYRDTAVGFRCARSLQG